jgi:PAT family beta-lactamase induction signal transducer AmpG
MLVGVVATILAPEATAIAAPPPTLADAVIKPLLQFLARPSGWLVLAFVLMFKLPDEFAASMSIPFMRDLEISLVDIGMIRQGLGIFITILGAFVGGGIVARLGIMRSLWIFGVLQAVSNLGYLALAHFGPDYAVLVAVICVENFCSGLVTAGFVAFLMSQCDPRFSATQFALLSSLMAVTRILSPAPAGLVAELVSWPVFFILTIALSAPAMVMLLWIRPRPQSQSEDEPRGFDVILPPAPMENATPVR